MAFYFFTELNKLNAQEEQNSYGYTEKASNKETYNLHNKFSVTEGAAVFSITKSLVFFQEDKSDASLLNVALFPLESNYMAGLPIKFFVYRGISKMSILKANNEIKEVDSSWKTNNILQIIHENQEKINEKTGTADKANSGVLGLGLNGLENSVLLESILFDHTDSFHPLIVPGGCEIGKFYGGSKLISVEVILDKIGEEANLAFLKANENKLEVDELVLDNSLTEKEKKRKVFKDRAEREKVLSYMDITAFYGSCYNQNYNIDGVEDNNISALFEKFYNKNTVYIDVRDERGFSFNHFLKERENLSLGFYDGQNEIQYQELNYYSEWPILKLSNKAYLNSKKEFFLKLPITIGMPEVANVLTSFTKKVSLKKDAIYKKYRLLSQLDVIGNTKLKETEAIKLENWSFSDNSLGANYFLLKIDKLSFTDKSIALDSVWNGFFSLKMKNVFSLDNISEGEFRLKTYSSINAPLMTNDNLSGMYSPTIGLVADKYHITFFSLYDELVLEEDSSNRAIYPKLIETGKFNYTFDNATLSYQDNQAVGFLFQMINNKVEGYEINQYSISDTENSIDSKFLLIQKKEEGNVNFQKFMDNFHAITLTHEEYNELLSKVDSPIIDGDFITNCDYFIRGSQNKKYDYEQFSFLETSITVGIPKIVNTNEDAFSILIEEYPEEIKVNNKLITLTSAIAN